MPTFDEQAETFELRAGIADRSAEQIAHALVRLAPAAPAGPLLEIGAGTGQIGMHLAGLCPGYIGLDSSEEMLTRFRQRSPSARLVHADASAPWPFEAGTIGVVFASRAIHLLDPEHVTTELGRVAAAGGQFWLGRVRRGSDSPKSQIRAELQRQLRTRGIEPRGQAQEEVLYERFESAGGRTLGAHRVATWQIQTTPARVVEQWRDKSGLAGHQLATHVKSSVLSAVGRWLQDFYDDPERPIQSEESYWLSGVALV